MQTLSFLGENEYLGPQWGISQISLKLLIPLYTNLSTCTHQYIIFSVLNGEVNFLTPSASLSPFSSVFFDYRFSHVSLC